MMYLQKWILKKDTMSPRGQMVSQWEKLRMLAALKKNGATPWVS